MKVSKIKFQDFNPKDTSHLSFAVVMAKFDNKWIFVRHKERSTLEIPGGKRERGEGIIKAAYRELFEETGAKVARIKPLDVYQIFFEEECPPTYGLLCYAEINELDKIPNSEIAEIFFYEDCPKNLTYPDIQPYLFERTLIKTQIVDKTQNYNHIIWDWNGTLIDDVDVAVQSVSTLLDEHNLPELCSIKYRETFGFPISSYYEKIGFDLNSVSFDFLCERFHEEYNKNRLSKGKLFSDVTHHLEFFSHTKKQSILSAGAQWHLDEWVRHYEIEHYFDHIFGIDNHHAASKISRGYELIETSKYDKKQTILIGDTDHDLEVGQELGIDVLLIANGHQSYERLSQIHSNVIETRM